VFLELGNFDSIQLAIENTPNTQPERKTAQSKSATIAEGWGRARQVSRTATKDDAGCMQRLGGGGHAVVCHPPARRLQVLRRHRAPQLQREGQHRPLSITQLGVTAGCIGHARTRTSGNSNKVHPELEAPFARI